MERSTLIFKAFGGGFPRYSYVGTINSRHCKTDFLSEGAIGENCTITDCFYTGLKPGKFGVGISGDRLSKLSKMKLLKHKIMFVAKKVPDNQFFDIEFADCPNRENVR